MLEKTNALYVTDVKTTPTVPIWLGFSSVAHFHQSLQNDDASVERQECGCLLLQLLLFQQQREYTQHRGPLTIALCIVLHRFGAFRLHRHLCGSDRRVERC